MKCYHKSNVGDTTYYTSHPEEDMNYYDTLDRDEFARKYGCQPEDWGQPIPLDCAHVRGVEAVRCGERDGRLHVVYVAADEIEIWTGTACQDIDGYRWECEAVD